MASVTQAWGYWHNGNELILIGYEPAGALGKFVRKALFWGLLGLPETKCTLIFNNKILDTGITKEPLFGEGQSWQLRAQVKDMKGETLLLHAFISSSLLGVVKSRLLINGNEVLLKSGSEIKSEVDSKKKEYIWEFRAMFESMEKEHGSEWKEILKNVPMPEEVRRGIESMKKENPGGFEETMRLLGQEFGPEVEVVFRNAGAAKRL
jgi:hypothetical protein